MTWRLGTNDIDWELLESKLMKPLVPTFKQLINQYELPKKTSDEATRIMILGVPGSGKGTIIEKLKENDYEFIVHSTGDVMSNLARDLYGINNRDEIRHKLRLRQQDDLQRQAVQIISERCKDLSGVYLFDCHATTLTERGFLFGLDPQNFYNYAPDAIVYLRANPSEILKRRKEDTSRDRGTNLESIILNDKFNLEILRAISKTTGVTVYTIWTNTKEDIPIATMALKEIIEHARPLHLQSVDTSYNNPRSKTDIPTNALLTTELVRQTPDYIKPIIDAGNGVLDIARTVSEHSRMPVYLIANKGGGSVFPWSVDHWSSQFEDSKMLQQFFKELRQNEHYKDYEKLRDEHMAIVNELTPGFGNLIRSNSYCLNYPSEVAQGHLDTAILQTAKSFILKGKLSSFVYPVSNLRLPNHECLNYDISDIRSRLLHVNQLNDIKIIVADTSRGDCNYVFGHYSCLLKRTPSIKYTEDSFLGNDDDLSDNEGVPQLRITPDSRTEYELSGRPSRDKLSQAIASDIIYYDPRADAWWDGIPEVIYPAHKVMCSTTIGRMPLQDFLRIRVERESGQWDRRKGWEYRVDQALSLKTE